jgi:SNF2 family DNA or RNA helicase
LELLLLQHLVVHLRKCCNHPYLFSGAEPDFDGTTKEEIISSSGKLQVGGKTT